MLATVHVIDSSEQNALIEKAAYYISKETNISRTTIRNYITKVIQSEVDIRNIVPMSEIRYMNDQDRRQVYETIFHSICLHLNFGSEFERIISERIYQEWKNENTVS